MRHKTDINCFGAYFGGQAYGETAHMLMFLLSADNFIFKRSYLWALDLKVLKYLNAEPPPHWNQSLNKGNKGGRNEKIKMFMPNVPRLPKLAYGNRKTDFEWIEVTWA